MSWLRSTSRLHVWPGDVRPVRFLAVVMVATGIFSVAAGVPALPTTDDASLTALVRTAAANEVAASQDNSIKHMFRSRKQTPHGSQTRLYVETSEAIAAMTIAYDDKPISNDQLQGEFRHLDHLIVDRNDLRRKQKQEHEDAEHTLRIVKAMPDAFLYEFDGTESSRPGVGKAGDELVRLRFGPNPHYSPPSRVEQVLTGMRGTVLIDKDGGRIAQISAVLFREVSFGWGILGHLDKGGSFLVEQAEVGDGTWEITHISLNFTGKIMLVKAIAIKSDETFSDFRSVPGDITFAKGVELLKQEWARLQQTNAGTATATKRPD
jgi:hypothetical protein